MKQHVNLGLALISVIGFCYSTFHLLYYQQEAAFLFSLFFTILFLESFIGHVRVRHDHKQQSTELKAVGYKVVPLSSNFMLTSILGLLISLFYIIPKTPSVPGGFDPLPWGFAFMLVFLFMFISSLISMTQAPIAGEDNVTKELEELHMEQLNIGR